jgi:hypothetical protein
VEDYVGQQRDRFAAYYALPGKRNAEDEAAVLRAAEAYDSAADAGELSDVDLNIIVAVASSARMMQWANAIELLGMLVQNFPQAVAAVEQMLADKRSHVRFAAVCVMQSASNVPANDEMIRRMFRDRSSKVRRKAAETAERPGLPQPRRRTCDRVRRGGSFGNQGRDAIVVGFSTRRISTAARRTG